MPPAVRLQEDGLMGATGAQATPSQTSPFAAAGWGSRHASSAQLPWVCQRRSSGEGLRGAIGSEPETTQAACSRGALSIPELWGRTLNASSTCRAEHTPCQAGADVGSGSSRDEATPRTALPTCAQLRRGTRDDVSGAHSRVVTQASASQRLSGSRGGTLRQRDHPLQSNAWNGNSHTSHSPSHSSHSPSYTSHSPSHTSRSPSHTSNSPSHSNHSPSPIGIWAGGARRTQLGALSKGSEGTDEAEGEQGSTPQQSPWQWLRCVAFGEAAVLALFLLLFSSSLGRHVAAWVVPPALARLFSLVSVLGIASELLLLGDSFRSKFQLRPGASTGLHMGAMALPAALLARAVLHSAWTVPGASEQGSLTLPSCAHIRVSEHVPCAPSALDLHCWGALSCAASALAGALALHLITRGVKATGERTAGRAAELGEPEPAGAPERETLRVNGHGTPSFTGPDTHPSSSFSGGGDPDKEGLLLPDWRDLGPFFVGWGAASSCVAAAAAACWGLAAAPSVLILSSPALGPVLWLLCLSLLSSVFFAGTLTLFPRSFTAGEAMLASQGLTLYAGDALGMTLTRLAPSLPLPSFGTPFTATGDQIHAIIQAMVLGLLLLPALGTALTRLASSALIPAPPQHTHENSSDISSSQSRNGSEVRKTQGEGEGSDTGGGGVCADDGSGKGQTASKGAASAGALQAKLPRSVGFALGTGLVVLVGAPLWLRWVGGMTQHPVLWALGQILEDPQPRASLCLYWLTTALLPLPLLQRAAAAGVVPQIILRKAYHLMAVAMFVPAMLLQPGFLRLAFGVALCAFLFLEVLRVCHVAPLGPLLDKFMRAFADTRDAGPIIVSHFSLLLGCALPLWLAPYPSSSHPAAVGTRGPAYLAPFAGMLSIGIGDTMASAVGKHYGRHRIARDSPKTLEGTLACIASTFVACAGLVPSLCAIHGCSFIARDWAQVLVATAVSGLLEAYTEQLDNAFVPLLYFASLAVL